MNDSSPWQSHHPFLDGRPKKLLIAGSWMEAKSGRTIASVNPSTGETLGSIADGAAEDVDAAVAAARKAFDGGPWSRLRPFHRQELLLKLADLVERHFEELSWLDVLDMGVPISVALGRRQRVIGMIRYYAGMATALHGETIDNSTPGGDFVSFTAKEPIGVVGIIIPWNGPLVASLWKICPGLATGCTMVLKPSEEASFTALRLCELLLEAGLPEGVLNIVTGRGDAGAALAAHPDVDKIAFTGSTQVGQQIVRASAGNLKKLTLELGGKSANIVLADADLDVAVPGAAMAVFANSGQICSAGTRLFVAQSIYKEFTERVAAFGNSLKVGNSAEAATQIGPIVSAKQLKSVQGYLDAGREEGAVVLAGGERLATGILARGNFVAPTVFAQVTDQMKIAQEEIFGPVISALPFDSLEDVVRRANANPYGLGSGVWTRDVGIAHRLAKSIRAGSVWINCYQVSDPAVPFGGYKMSGYGRESGLQHLDEFLNVKSVWIRTD